MTRCPHVFKDCTYCIKEKGHKGRHLRPLPEQVVPASNQENK